MASRQIKLNAFMRPASIHTGAWRYPGAWPDMNFNFAHIKEAIQKLEAAKFDAFFMADHMAVLNMPMDALKRSHTSTSFEPFTLLSALSQATSHIGLVATGSTTFDVPYHIARRFASLDHISGGRAGWNIVTTSNPDAALNFGMDEHMEHDERYRRAREFYDVVTGLWDSWADDAFIRDVESGIFFDPDKMHVLNHKGKYLVGEGPAQHRAPGAGLAGDRAGRRLRRRTPACRRDRRDGVHGAAEHEGRSGVLRRRERPHAEGRPQPRAHDDHAGLLRHAGRDQGGGAEEARPARQQGELRQRHRLAVDRARPRRLEVRSGQAAARRHPGEQRLRERPRARHRARQAREPDRAPARAAAGRLRRPRHGRHRQDRRRRDGGMARRPRPPTASPSSSPICPARSTSSATSSCRSCSAAACSARNTRARRCAKISGCRGRATASSTPKPVAAE